ncbi:ribosomal protection-like ABC-F family protein [Brevibacillus borstelensis]|uniref:ribosomal protection-like ABC-F family protein n=1 Tax=Brevibacillus borstelensis TaxID=45462 RepID=UPI00203B0F6B|nr:ABC-F type ribosomal protection protein [Brevibacillus borstelensis]MCM3473152.1 ABC-F type ribosomal protection protein [Brevibacillus borstelensis]MCM3625113.1 ABC-F type ribosomal protection protein [Brevibacillus borstelensis]
MLLLEARQIEKSFGDRVIFEAKKLEVFYGDRIGIVGKNGVGKSTLMHVLAGLTQPDAGQVNWYGSTALIQQIDQGEEAAETTGHARRMWGISHVHSQMSGGETVRLKIAAALEQQAPLLFADEPTSHLDMTGIRQLEESLLAYDGAVILISHDRELLDTICTRIWEVEDGKISEYKGNYSDYREQKEKKREREWFEYEEYRKEKERLTQAFTETKQRASEIRKAPKRMGNSEARLHKRKANGKREKVEKAALAMESRLARLEKKEKPKELPSVKFDVNHYGEQHGRTIIQVQKVTRRVEGKTLFEKLSFSVRPGQKVAIIGGNGCGKSTLLSMIYSQADGISVSPSSRVGYFSQSLSILDENKSIWNNVRESSRHSDTTIRTALARMLFTNDEIHKTVSVLSGGERVKTALAKVFLGDYNVLLLDEPTNFLDIPTQEELERILLEFPGTILFASHDRKFIQRLADAVLCLDEEKLTLFSGTYQEYLERKNKPKRGREEERMVLETRLTDLIGRLSSPKLEQAEKEEMERAYRETLKQLRELDRE